MEPEWLARFPAPQALSIPFPMAASANAGNYSVTVSNGCRQRDL